MGKKPQVYTESIALSTSSANYTIDLCTKNIKTGDRVDLFNVGTCRLSVKLFSNAAEIPTEITQYGEGIIIIPPFTNIRLCQSFQGIIIHTEEDDALINVTIENDN